MVFRPDRRAGIVAALIILITIVGIQALVLANLVRQSFGMGQFVTALLFVACMTGLAAWAYWFHELVSLSYRLDRDALIIRCGWIERTVPLRLVQRCIQGSEAARGARFHGIGWPGFSRGHLHLRGIGRVREYSTVPIEQQLILVCAETAEGPVAEQYFSVAISPRDQTRFIRTLQALQEVGPLHEVQPGMRWYGLGAWSAWHDSTFLALLSSAVLLGLGLYGVLAVRYDALPTRLPLHFGANGFADRIALKKYLLVVPAIGTITTVLNGSIGVLVHRHERLASLLLSGSALGIIDLLWVALVGLIY